MIKLFEPHETDFSHNGVGILDPDIQNPVIEEAKNDLFTFSFDYPIHAIHGSQIKARMLVTADDPENPQQLFRILKVTKVNGMLNVMAYHLFYDLAGNEIEDVNIVNQNGQDAINHALAGTVLPHKFSGFSNIEKTANIRVVRMSPVRFLIDTQTDNNFITRLGGELKRVNYRFWMTTIRGSDNGATVRWRKSLVGYKAAWDFTPVVTRIRPIGFNGITIPEKFVDSPKINQYDHIFIKEIKYEDIKAIDPAKKDNEPDAVPLPEAQRRLRAAAASEFSMNHIDDPKVTLTVDIAPLRNTVEYRDIKSLETINPWDTVTVINEHDGLNVKIRLNRYRYNPLTHRYISMTLGNEQGNFTDMSGDINRAKNAADDAKKSADDAKKSADDAAQSADGKNKVFYGPDQPANPADGDLWYKKNGDKTEMWRYDGKAKPPHWVLVVDDATGEEVKKRVDEASKEAQRATDNANAAVDKANKAINDAGFAKDEADKANQAANDAASKAKQADDNASKALSDADNAIKHVDTVDQRVKVQITDIKGELARKVSQETVDGIKKTVDMHETLIQQNKNAISIKADQSSVDKINGSVNTLNSELKIQADQISQRVTHAELDKYGDKTWTQSQITQLSDKINITVGKIGQRNLVYNSEIIKTDGWVGNTAIDVGDNQWDSRNGSHSLAIRGAYPVGEWHSVESKSVPAVAGAKYSFSGYLFFSGAIKQPTPKSIFLEIDAFDDQGTRVFNQGVGFDMSRLTDIQFLTANGLTLPAAAKKLTLAVQIEGGNFNLMLNHPMIVQALTIGSYQPDQISQSQIMQLRDDINLRVQKGDVINQINIGPESILIAGQKVHITGQTTIDNAIIRDAMIDSIKADKITAGTLNATSINVINRNATSITTGTLRGANMSLNLNTGQADFQKGRIHSTNGHLDLNIDDGTLSVIGYSKAGIRIAEDKFDVVSSFTDSVPNCGHIGVDLVSSIGVNGLEVLGRQSVSVGTLNFRPSDLIGIGKKARITASSVTNNLSLSATGTTYIYGGNKDSSAPTYIAIGDKQNISRGNNNFIRMQASHVFMPSVAWNKAPGPANVYTSDNGELFRVY